MRLIDYFSKRNKIFYRLNILKAVLVTWLIGVGFFFGFMFLASILSGALQMNIPQHELPPELRINELTTEEELETYAERFTEYVEKEFPERSFFVQVYAFLSFFTTLAGSFIIIFTIFPYWKWLWKKEFRRENW